VLIFKDGDNTYTAKVADFGFSTHFHSEQEDLIQMPKSVPWTAPEHHSRYFTLQSAKAMDVYSFSMLCLWLLFHKHHRIIPDPSVAEHDSQTLSFEEEAQSEKKDDRLPKWAMQLVADDANIRAEIKDNLSCLFQSNLHSEPEMRMTDWDRLLGCLAAAR
jgi:serine/threonine protein kinase